MQEFCKRRAVQVLGFVFFSAFFTASREWALLAGPQGLVPAVLVPELPNPVLWMIGFGETQIFWVCSCGMVISVAMFLFPGPRWIVLPSLVICWLLQLALVNS